MAKEDFRFHHTLRVRWAECDAQAIVYNAAYLTWAEVGLAEYCRHLGFRMYKLAELNLFDTVTAKATIDYKAPARLDDLVEVYVRVVQIGNTSINFRCETYRENEDQLLNRVDCVYVSYDNRAQRPRRVPEAIRELFAHFEETGEALSLDHYPLFGEALA